MLNTKKTLFSCEQEIAPLEISAEGFLRGGFVGIQITTMGAKNPNCLCYNKSCDNVTCDNISCTNEGCDNVLCINDDCINYPTPTPKTTTPAPETLPKIVTIF